MQKRRVLTVFKMQHKLFWQRLCEIELLFELVNSSACVNKLLLTRKERMALRAYINAQLGLCGTCLESFAASTLYRCFYIFRMYSLFHLYFTPYRLS